MGVVRGVVAFRWGFSGSHMRCSMKPFRSEGRLMRATPCLMASSATAVATCGRNRGLTDYPKLESSPKVKYRYLLSGGLFRQGIAPEEPQQGSRLDRRSSR